MEAARGVGMTVSVGSWLGPYKLDSKLGEGGMGIVYEAVARNGRRVAVKVASSDDERARRRFRAEAIAGMTVRHLNIASTLAACTVDGCSYLVMERARGESLRRRIQCGPPSSLVDAVNITRQILAGVGALHAAGIVHGDIKADNVIVETCDDGSLAVKLIDLGLARMNVDDESNETIAGTPEYMAPELGRGTGVSVAADLYAIGIVLYELIIGITPFGGSNTTETLNRHAAEPLTPPSVLRSTVPSILDDILAQALAKEPARRFPSAEAFAESLLPVLAALPKISDPYAKRFSREAPTVEWPVRCARGTSRRLSSCS
jgi:eukaryotic-like serine/threonine-protein kinase